MNHRYLIGGLLLALLYFTAVFVPAVAQVAPPGSLPAVGVAQATAAPTTRPTGAATASSTRAATTAVAGISAADVEKLVNDMFNKVDRNLALWNIQPGLGTVMIEYGNRLARMWFAGNADNWDMAKYQLDEMLEIQEVGETTRPARAPMLKAFEDNYLASVNKAILAKDKTAFTKAVNDAVAGCNGCHMASTGAAKDPPYTWKSFQYVKIQIPKIDPASYLDWKGGGQGNYVSGPTAPTATPRAALSGTLDAAGVEKLVNSKFNGVDRSLALWNIQPGLGTVMIEYGNRFSRMFFAAKAANWDMAKYQHDEMLEIQEVGEITRPGRAPMLKAFEDAYMTAIDKAIAAKDNKAFDDAFSKAVAGCNGCHAASTGAAKDSPYTWKSYQYVKVQVPTTDNNDYILWKSDKGTGNYVPSAPAGPTSTPKPPLTGALEAAGVQKLVTNKFNQVDRSLALWNIQPGLGTVMIEYARRYAQLKFALDAGNWDMAKYQLDEMVEIQEVGETTRPGRAPMLKAFEDGFLKPLDAAITAKDKSKADSALKIATGGCNGCHAASMGTAMDSANTWKSYGWIQVQLPPTDPADYILWNAGGGNTGNYVIPAVGTPSAGTPSTPGQQPTAAVTTTSATVAPTTRPTTAATGGATAAPTTAAAGSPPKLPADHAGRTACLVCHATGAGGAPKIPSANPDHTAFTDANNAAMCLACHVQTK